jgi:putative ABC transport system substrate-binding protein
MRRREFTTLLGGAIAWPLVARAQQGERVRRIAVLMGFPNDAQGQARITVIRQELSKLGWAEGRNAHIDIRWAAGDPGLTQTYAAELVRLEPDVIIANSSLGVNALLRETRTIPVIFMAVPEWHSRSTPAPELPAGWRWRRRPFSGGGPSSRVWRTRAVMLRALA